MPPLPLDTYMKFKKGRDHIQKVLHVNQKESIKINGYDSSSWIYKRPIKIMDTNADYSYKLTSDICSPKEFMQTIITMDICSWHGYINTK